MIHHSNGQLIAESLRDLPDLLDSLGCRRVLLVLDRGAARATGVESALPDLVGNRLAGIFDEFTPNPSSTQPLAAARYANQLEADTMLAFGGGSCMDVAKVGALAAALPTHADQLVEGMSMAGVSPLRIVAIPTTSGTGSEATHFSAVYVHGKKTSVAHPGMRPQGVVLDASLHAAMPPLLAATTGLDALCQAMESWWAVGATEESLTYARDSQRALSEHLLPSVKSADPTRRERVMWGAHVAGRAINLSKTTAAHALSYELTTRFGLAHGLAVALTLGHVAKFNAGVTEADCTHPGGVQRVRTLVAECCANTLGCTPVEMPDRMRSLLRELNLPDTLQSAGVTRDALQPMAAAADTVRLSNNPRRLTPELAAELLEAAF